MTSPVSPTAAARGAEPDDDAVPSSSAHPARPPSRSLTRAFLVANLVGQILIVVTGGAVRLTGSGLGCSTWPQCEPGSFTPAFHEALSIHPYIEFGNRLVSVLLVSVTLVVAVRLGRDRSRSRDLRALALIPLAGVLVQAVVGGLSVLWELHPAIVGLHLLVSMGLIAASAVLLERFDEPDGPARPVVNRRVALLVRGLAATAAVVLVLGVLVTGSGPHSGDEELGYRFALDPYAMARIHSLAVWVFIGFGLALLAATRGGPARLRRRLWLLAAVTGIQAAIGYVQVFTGLPELLVGAHMLGAALLAAATAHVYVGMRERRPVARAGGPARSLDVGRRA